MTSQPARAANAVSIDASAVQAASILVDAAFLDESKHEEIAKGIATWNIPGFQANRDLVAYPDGGLYNPVALTFDPSFNSQDFSKPIKHFKHPVLDDVKRPESDDDLAFMTVLQLGSLIRSKQVTSVELVKLYTGRLKKEDHVLKAVVTYTEELALEQASAADRLLSQGNYLGPLHGVPYGLKDIFAVPGYKTTWGSKSYKDQVIDKESWVYQKLKKAGAVLIAKLAPGSLAYDDIWFGGQTKNPWNIMEGSTGSSAGPASSTCAGNVPFAIGTETSGSITIPAARVGVTALRPTFGMVGRSWSMSLSESLDKIGPFCRSAEDCAVIIDILRGKDPDDWSSKNIYLDDPFAMDVTELRVGYLPDADMEVVKVLENKGVKMVPFELKYSLSTVQFTLKITMEVDVLAHFDHWQRAGLDEDYEDQNAWPVVVRRSRLISAVDYLQAQRARGKLALELKELMEKQKVDAFVGNATDWEWICAGNLAGMPVIVIPTGLKDVTDPPANGTKRRTTITSGIYAAPYQDATVLALAMAYQSVTNHHVQRPPVDRLSPDDPALSSTSTD
ncbi:hypothetical protein KC19_10G003700 [Ceratodon purpureus]|uniref:Amidase domain-containing protein n=1 Tax=Ceratodon purpureus TaxID=3225 RepID=A0A8T0GF93_CERPU|nr:hypothetical protein KC19_10G003700 [Ceratodon purpureus]